MKAVKRIRNYALICIVALLACLCIFCVLRGGRDNIVASAESNTTLKYAMTFDYTNTHVDKGTTKHLGNGTTVTSARVQYSAGSYGSAELGKTTVSISIWGGSSSGTGVLENGGAIKSNTVNISLTYGEFKFGSYSLTGSKGTKFEKTFTAVANMSSISQTLPDDYYTLSYSIQTQPSYSTSGSSYYHATLTTRFYVDTTAPSLRFNAYNKTDAAVTWDNNTDFESPTSATYKLDGEQIGNYTSGARLSKEGKYEITVMDKAGNSSMATLYVDKTAPELKRSAEYSKTGANVKWTVGKYETPVSATYKHNGVSKGAYTSGTDLSDEGKYEITATDAAGNASSTTFYIDRTAPSLSRTAEYSKTSANAKWSVGSYDTPVTATYKHNGKSKGEYVSGTNLTAEGYYEITATDAAGNSSNTTFYIDKTAPVLKRSAEYSKTSADVKWTVESYETPVTATYKLNGVSKGVYTPGTDLSDEGKYEITATDAAGNSSNTTFYIDRTAPTLTFSANGDAITNRYTNKNFTAYGDDTLSGVDKIEIYLDGRYTAYNGALCSDNGEYLFRVTDRAGNISTATTTLYRTDTFGNLASIRDAYKLNSWYVVTLPARIFTTDSKDVAGKYSFESYDKALAFAVTKEREFRVSNVQGGYIYVSASNENVAQKYDTESALNVVVEKYARKYISARQISNSNGSDRYYIEPESLVRNSPVLPGYLSAYNRLPRIFARSTALWTLPNVKYISKMPYSVTAKYLGDVAEATAQNEIEIPTGITLPDAISEYRQGFYLITERDGAGNVEQYIIYSDAELPAARVTAESGDGVREFTLDADYTKNEIPYFLSLGFDEITDNADSYITLKVEKGSVTKYYTQSDELPVLGSDEFTSGKYTVTIFDRSLNALVFDVYIAGAPPSMTHGSLAADKPECKISFVTSDKFNVITGITLYKIEYDGSKTVLDTDGLGTPVNAATLSYVLTVGGKYGATVTDNYRRTVEIPPIFYLKGLPAGKLSGVKDGGRTNKNVSFTFDSGDVAEFFTLHPNGERRPFNGYTVQTGASQTTYNITADDDTSFEYLVFLHNAHDLSLFVEYTFEIDTVLPEFEITDSDGNVIPPDGATNKPFAIKWNETGVSMRYYTSRSGQLGAVKYNMNTVLSQGVLYYFTISDSIGNELEFTVLLDNFVDYTLGGKYNAVDGVLYANAPLTFTVNEPTQVFEVENSDGYVIDNGGALTQAGRYEITVTDNYRNMLTLCIVLDFTPPIIELSGAGIGGAVKNDVVVTASNYDYLYLADSRGNKLRDVANGEVFTDAGVYKIVASDYAGNVATATFSIDLTVDFTLSVPNGAVTTQIVTLTTEEQIDIAVTFNGEKIDSTKKFTDCGEYELTLTDALGNSVSCVFTIIPNKSQTLDQRLPFGTRVISVLKNGVAYAVADPTTLRFVETGIYAVKLDCNGTIYELTVETDSTPPVVTILNENNEVKLTAVDKSNVTFSLTLDGEDIKCRVGQTLDEPGHYVLTVTDELGNVAVYEFDIAFQLNTLAIVAIVIGCIALAVVVFLIIRARRKPRLK